MKKKFLLTIWAVLLLLINSTFSQERKDSIDLNSLSLEDLMNMEVTGVSRYKQSTDQTPSTVIVISEQQIAERGYEDLSDVLKDVPGFDIVDNAGRYGEYYTLRGIQGSDRFLVLIDGHKLNPASGTFLSVGNSISVRFVKQIEIVYGPSSAVYGADAYSGIINMISKENSDNTFEITASGNYGAMNRADGYIEGHLKVNDDLSFYLAARYFQSKGPDFVGRGSVYDEIAKYKTPWTPEFEQPIQDNNIYFRTKYKKLTLGYFRQSFEEGNAMGLNTSAYVFNKENVWKTSSNSFWLSYKYEMSEKSSLNVDVNYINHIQDPGSQFLKWKTSGATNNFVETFNQYMTGKDNTGKATVFYTNVLAEKLQLIVGVDYEYTQSIPPYANDEVLGNSFKYSGDNATKIDDNLTINEQRVAGFGQFTYSPIKYMDIILGGRYDYSSRYKGTFNPRMGLILYPFEKTTVKFIFGTAFQAPSLFYQYEQFGTPTVAMLSVAEVQKIPQYANWELNNQKVQSFDINITQKIAENFRFNISGYYNILTDIIERFTFSAAEYNKYFNKTTPGIRNENIGKQEIKGLDVAVDALLVSNLQLFAYYSYCDAVSTVNGKESDVARVAQQKAWIGFTYRNLFNYVNISPRYRWVGDINNINLVDFPDAKQKGYSTLDLSFSIVNLVKNLKLYSVFENVLNEEYSQGGLLNQAAPYLSSIPQNGFSFRVGVEYKF